MAKFRNDRLVLVFDTDKAHFQQGLHQQKRRSIKFVLAESNSRCAHEQEAPSRNLGGNLRSCNTALGQPAEVHAATKLLIRTLFEEVG